MIDISKMVQLDSQVINFGEYICGKILGSTLQVTNTSSHELILELTVDGNVVEYDCDEILGPY